MSHNGKHSALFTEQLHFTAQLNPSDNALVKYSSLKAHGRAIYFATRDWLENSAPETQNKAKGLPGDLMVACCTLFAQPIEDMPKNEERVYMIPALRLHKGGFTRPGASFGRGFTLQSILKQEDCRF